MKKIYTILILSLIAASAMPQTATFINWPDGIAPDIDGVEDDIWQYVEFNEVTHKFGAELPTLNPYTGWQAGWNDTSIFIIIIVTDNYYCDKWCSGTADSLSDKVEIYFDINDILHDGIGASTMYSDSGTGHYRFAAGPDSSFDAGILEGSHSIDVASKWHIQYAYNVCFPNYVFEYAVRINNGYGSLTQKDGSVYVPTGGNEDTIGFEVTIIDRDEGDLGPKRANWHTPEGSLIDAWENMDVAGTVRISREELPCIMYTSNKKSISNCGVRNIKTKNIKNILIFPNPATDKITIFGAGDIKRATFIDILGRTVKTLQNHNAGNMEIDINDLNNGIYFIKLTGIKGNLITRPFVKQ